MTDKIPILSLLNYTILVEKISFIRTSNIIITTHLGQDNNNTLHNTKLCIRYTLSFHILSKVKFIIHNQNNL